MLSGFSGMRISSRMYLQTIISLSNLVRDNVEQADVLDVAPGVADVEDTGAADDEVPDETGRAFPERERDADHDDRHVYGHARVEEGHGQHGCQKRDDRRVIMVSRTLILIGNEP